MAARTRRRHRPERDDRLLPRNHLPGDFGSPVVEAEKLAVGAEPVVAYAYGVRRPSHPGSIAHSDLEVPQVTRQQRHAPRPVHQTRQGSRDQRQFSLIAAVVERGNRAQPSRHLEPSDATGTKDPHQLADVPQTVVGAYVLEGQPAINQVERIVGEDAQVIAVDVVEVKAGLWVPLSGLGEHRGGDVDAVIGGDVPSQGPGTAPYAAAKLKAAAAGRHGEAQP